MCKVLHYDYEHLYWGKIIGELSREKGADYKFIMPDENQNGFEIFSNALNEFNPDLVLVHPGSSSQAKFFRHLIKEGYGGKCALISADVGEYYVCDGIAVIDINDNVSVEKLVERKSVFDVKDNLILDFL